MFFYINLIFSLFSLTFVAVRTQDGEIFSNLFDGGLTPMQNFKADLYLMENKIQAVKKEELEKVEIKLYYGSFCSNCRIFDTKSLRPTVEKLAPFLNVHLYPYGNAQTTDNGNGTFEFKCQHGPKECYGNKLHACAIDYLSNNKEAVLFNSCMMEMSRKDNGSNDKAADECGKRMNIDPNGIKQCAKGDKGNQLLKYYGDETNKAHFFVIPWVMINGVEIRKDCNLLLEVCEAFRKPPPECVQIV